MATLSIWNYFTLTDIRGIARAGRQGAAADDSSTSMDLTASTTPAITGYCFSNTNTLATATVVTAYTAASDFPATFDYGFFVSDVTMYIQLIGSATNYTHQCFAKVPYVFPGSILAAANTTLITGGSEPSVTAISKVVIGNYSGGTGYYDLFLID